jgi:hypothetical protein
MKSKDDTARAILGVMQFYGMTEADVREFYMDEVYAMQELHKLGIDLGNQRVKSIINKMDLEPAVDKGKDVAESEVSFEL